jgi:cell division protein FtsB
VRGWLWIPGLVAGALCWAALDQGSGLLKSRQLRSDLHAAEARIASLGREIEELRRQASQLEGDEFAIERAIREDLGFSRAGETLVRLSPPVDPTPRLD